MINPNLLFGRLGNRLFKEAFIYAQARNGLIPNVYVQDYKYFEKYEDEIKKYFGQGIGFINKVSIQVRRGDYVENEFYIDLSETDYYKNAMAKFPNDYFLVFSDDIEWCKQQEIFKNCEFNENKSDFEDLNKMASCKCNIIANSSFGWWAAYLNSSPGKIVIAPKKWYTDGVERTICPPEWHRL